MSISQQQEQEQEQHDEQRLPIRLPDGTRVLWTPLQIAQYDDDWTVDLLPLSPEQFELGCARLKCCLAHADGETCELCGEDEKK